MVLPVHNTMIPCFCPPFWLPKPSPPPGTAWWFCAASSLCTWSRDGSPPPRRRRSSSFAPAVATATPQAGEEVQPQTVWVLMFISDVFPNDIIFFQTWVRRCPNGWIKRQTWFFNKKVPLVVAICLECVGTLENEDPVVLDKGSQNEYIQC